MMVTTPKELRRDLPTNESDVEQSDIKQAKNIKTIIAKIFFSTIKKLPHEII